MGSKPINIVIFYLTNPQTKKYCILNKKYKRRRKWIGLQDRESDLPVFYYPHYPKKFSLTMVITNNLNTGLIGDSAVLTAFKQQ